MIYQQSSIYKQGGGGGGYKDGGALIDGDFIKVENNTLSSYDNTNRYDVNFYFEVGDGEVINSVVELTTTLTATIHVYIFKNGLFIPLGNVGGNTVNGGDDYNLTIIGKSFILENVTTFQDAPDYGVYEDEIYEFIEVGNIVWTKTNIEFKNLADSKFDNVYKSYVPANGNYDFIKPPYRLPTVDEATSLASWAGTSPAYHLKSNTADWNFGGAGDNSTGFGARPGGYYIGNNIYQLGGLAEFLTSKFSGTTASVFGFRDDNNNSIVYGSASSNYYINVRLVVDI